MEWKRSMITIADILSPEDILLDFQAETQVRALSKVADLLEKDDRVSDWDRFYKGIMAGASCIYNESGCGICIAHVRTNAVDDMVMAAGRSGEGIAFDESGMRVHLIFVIGVPVALASDYLRIIGALARIFRTAKGETALLTAPTCKAFLDSLCTLEMEM